MLHLIADRLDLAIDLLTLGQYGLEQAPARDPRCTDGIDCRTRRHPAPGRRRGAHRELRLSRSSARPSRSRTS